MRYINGILKNWRREGYPKDDREVKKNGARSTGKSNAADKNEFTGFKPKKPRKLTEAERKRGRRKPHISVINAQDTGWILIPQEHMQPLAVSL